MVILHAILFELSLSCSISKPLQRTCKYLPEFFSTDGYNRMEWNHWSIADQTIGIEQQCREQLTTEMDCLHRPTKHLHGTVTTTMAMMVMVVWRPRRNLEPYPFRPVRPNAGSLKLNWIGRAHCAFSNTQKKGTSKGKQLHPGTTIESESVYLFEFAKSCTICLHTYIDRARGPIAPLRPLCT